jgi:PIN domain nuclease of toxin-antitoxin system
MKFLLDTHLLLWAAGEPEKLPEQARTIIEDENVELWFSAGSIWEIAIKRGLGRADFRVEPSLLRSGLLENAYVELPISGAHAAMIDLLPPLHKDPFDRMLVAQAIAESVTLLTSDALVAQYPGPMRKV